MLTPSEYMEAKRRILLAAEACAVISRATQTVRFDEEMYPEVMQAMAMNKDDVRAILADADILRHAAGVPLFPTQEVAHASDDPADNGTTVEPVPASQDEAHRGEVPADNAGDGGEVPAGGVHGGGSKRPVSRRNRSRKKKDS